MFPREPYQGMLHCDESGQWWEWIDGEWYRHTPKPATKQ